MPFLVFPYFPSHGRIRITCRRVFIKYTNSWHLLPEILMLRGSTGTCLQKLPGESHVAGLAWLRDLVWKPVLGAALALLLHRALSSLLLKSVSSPCTVSSVVSGSSLSRFASVNQGFHRSLIPTALLAEWGQVLGCVCVM